MKRKVLALIMVAVMLMASFAGCSNKGGETENTGTGSAGTDSQAEATSAPEKTEHLIITYLYMAAAPADLLKVQDAVNAITVPAINVEVEFKPLGIGDSFTNYSLWISSGETVDLMMLAFQDIKNYVNSGQIEELDAYISEEATPTLYSLMQEFPIATRVADKIYGLSPVGVNYGDKPGIIIRKDYFEETGYEVKDIYAMDELTTVFAAIKEKHPECYPLSALGSAITAGNSQFGMYYGGNAPGGNINAGYLMEADSTTIVNLFETEEYKNFLNQMAQWYQAGYIVPDAATTDTSNNELLQTGKVAAYAMSQKPEQFASDYGFKVTGMATGAGRIGAFYGATNWMVPITSSNPAAAIKFMDYLYSDSNLSNLILNGIEGTHYKVVDPDNNVIAFADGLDATNSPYYNLLGFWGDRRNEYTFSASATRQQHDAFTQECMNNKFKSYGFNFNSADVSNQILACQTVLDQYQKALETGSLGDKWEKTYNDMVSQLKNAGIDQVIAECQRQFDEFLAQ
ncbi:MAG TPA: extracellular solute-binding protein [Clostridiales bacterium]|nr:extracellular solute-binding protein [Clostridiales bacterium]